MQTTHAAPVATPEPFSLLTKWETHLKVDGRAPRTLEGLLIARADYEHRRRLAEIKSISAKLALLAPFLPELHRRGLRVSDRQIVTLDHGKTMRIRVPIMQTDDALHAALLELGFREIERKDWGPRDDLVTLKHGRSLLVQIDVKKKVVKDSVPCDCTTSGDGATVLCEGAPGPDPDVAFCKRLLPSGPGTSTAHS